MKANVFSHKFDKKDREEVLKKWCLGYSDYEMAELYNVAPSTIHRILGKISDRPIQKKKHLHETFLQDRLLLEQILEEIKHLKCLLIKGGG